MPSPQVPTSLTHVARRAWRDDCRGDSGMRRLVRRPHLPLLSDTDRAFLVVCGPDAGPSGRMTGELLTLPRPSNVVRCRPSMQVDGSSSSAYIAAEQHASDWLTVNLAVNSLSNQCKDAPRWCLTSIPGRWAEPASCVVG